MIENDMTQAAIVPFPRSKVQALRTARNLLADQIRTARAAGEPWEIEQVSAVPCEDGRHVTVYAHIDADRAFTACVPYPHAQEPWDDAEWLAAFNHVAAADPAVEI